MLSALPLAASEAACSTRELCYAACGPGSISFSSQTMNGYTVSFSCSSGSRQCCSNGKPLCSGWNQCPSGYKVKSGNTYGNDQDTCCDPTCASWNNCPSGFGLKENPASIAGSDPDTCCRWIQPTCYQAYTPSSSCSGYASCGYTCVGGYCSSSSCLCDCTVCAEAFPGYVLNVSSGKCALPAVNDCSTDRLCSAACGSPSYSFTLKKAVTNGPSLYNCRLQDVDCCSNGMTLCSGWNACPPGLKLRADASQTYGNTASACCTAIAKVSGTVSSFGKSLFWALVIICTVQFTYIFGRP